ncbi:PIG-L deacetylase family protein [Cohnella soli]|uniref:PIG-L deacetylase family protein n=1 Tax=Cohnella soli TaxID=425005 RepID=A0ABW0I247_9BACL
MGKTINVIVIFAHPDEGEKYAGGLSAMFAELGHRVKFLSLTNGDGGHYRLSGQDLIERRAGEAIEAKNRLGLAEYEILDCPDGALMPTLELRYEIIKQIREWKADIVITFHPEGGAHADNRYAGLAVSDAAPFVARVPNVVPEVECLDKAPIFLLMPDYSMKKRYKADVVVGIDAVLEKKLLGCDAHYSQFFEYQPWSKGLTVQELSDWQERREILMKDISEFIHVADEMKPALEKYYGKERANEFQYAEPFELAKYNSDGAESRVRALFPMFEHRGGVESQ